MGVRGSSPPTCLCPFRRPWTWRGRGIRVVGSKSLPAFQRVPIFPGGPGAVRLAAALAGALTVVACPAGALAGDGSPMVAAEVSRLHDVTGYTLRLGAAGSPSGGMSRLRFAFDQELLGVVFRRWPAGGTGASPSWCGLPAPWQAPAEPSPTPTGSAEPGGAGRTGWTACPTFVPTPGCWLGTGPWPTSPSWWSGAGKRAAGFRSGSATGTSASGLPAAIPTSWAQAPTPGSPLTSRAPPSGTPPATPWATRPSAGTPRGRMGRPSNSSTHPAWRWRAMTTTCDGRRSGRPGAAG